MERVGGVAVAVTVLGWVYTRMCIHWRRLSTPLTHRYVRYAALRVARRQQRQLSCVHGHM